MDGDHVAEFRRVDDIDFEEQHVGVTGYGVVAALFAFFGGVFGGVAGLAPVGEVVELAVVPQ